jgi:hypothetical protein
MIASRVNLLALSAASLFVAGCGASGPVSVPTGYTRFDSADKQFMCEAPNGWEINATGSKGVLSNSSFKSGSAKINIASDLAGSLMAGPGRPPDPNVEPPVVAIHEMGKEKLTNEIPNAQEQPADKIQTILGEGRISEFTAPGSFGGKIRGYRATVLSRDRRLTVICQCSESDWENLKGPFNKVIASLAPGAK